jgi:hypothetical protein
MKISKKASLAWERTGKLLIEAAKLKSELAKKQYENNPKRCLFCNEIIDYEKRRNKFCTHSHAAIYNNRSRGYKKNIGNSKCLHCGATKERKAGRTYNKYCTACISNGTAYRKKDFEDLKSDRARRGRLLREVGYKCEICGITEWQNQTVPVILDHIDGNSGNNKRENLRLICPNCDAQLPTYKNRNKGKGRKSRRDRYRNSISNN